MTRYARAKGSKASNEKLPEDSTPWGELRKQILNKQNNTPAEKKSEDDTSSSSGSEEQESGNSESRNQESGNAESKNQESVSGDNVWADITDEKSDAAAIDDEEAYSDFMVNDGTTSASPNTSILLLNKSPSNGVDSIKPDFVDSSSFIQNEKSDLKKGNNKTLDFKKPGKDGVISRGPDLSYTILLNGEVTKIVNFEGFNIKEVDAKRLYELRKRLYQEKKIPSSEIVRTIQLERRKAEKALQREQKNVCFNCRKSGHYVSECPEYKNFKNDSAIETGICYKCGSTEHTSHECRLKHASFRFAKCFICNEQGHISRECPDNPRGIYPKGGACKGCGDVTHFAKDCPDLTRQKVKKSITLGTLDNNDIEAIDDHFSPSSSQGRVEKKRKHSGMKSFYRQKRFRK